MNYLKHLMLWDGNPQEITDNINENYSGGNRVRIKKLHEIIDRDKSKNSTLAKIKPTPKKYISFIFTIIAPIYLNVSTTVNRWIDRPERNSEEFHNWSTLAVIYADFAVLSVYISISSICLLCVFTNNIASRWLLNKRYDNKYFKYLLFLLLITIFPFDAWVFYTFFSIFFEEINNFDIDDSNQTIISNSSFSELDFNTYVYISLLYIFAGMMIAVKRLQDFNLNYNSQKCIKNKDINHYDPILTTIVIEGLNLISGFSLIKFISWLRHQSVDATLDRIHKIKTKPESKTLKKQMDENFVFKIYIYLCILITIPVYLSFVAFFFSLSVFSFIHRIKEISFISTIEILDWDKYQFRSFLAFINNILSLDTGNERTLKSIFMFLFTGEDALEDNNELKSQINFMKLLLSYSIKENGLIQTVISFTQLTHKDIQKICILEIKAEAKEAKEAKEEAKEEAVEAGSSETTEESSEEETKQINNP